MPDKRWFWGGILILIMGLALVLPGQGRVNPGVSLEGRPVGGKVREEVTHLIGEMARERECLPENAIVDMDSGEIIPDRPGIRVDGAATLRRVMTARPGEDISLVLQERQAKITRENLLAQRGSLWGNLQPLAGAKTKILNDSPERVHNIKLATDLITNMVLQPGEEFAFSRVVGNPTGERGFQEAPIIDDQGQFTPSIGGGICQVSSTLYQAVCAAQLKVVERHAHSQEVDYTPRGTDAAVAPGEKDLRFCNSRPNPILILASATNQEVCCVILMGE
ncbi:MAG: VanW family protein [Firmicutes bacterium]|nr:VanW family protein [Bacillota bacterium]